jgi:hypothetical protein
VVGLVGVLEETGAVPGDALGAVTAILSGELIAAFAISYD